MILISVAFILFLAEVNSILQNTTCPLVKPEKLDLKELEGKWYITAAATDFNITGECAEIVFSNKNENLTDVSFNTFVNNSVTTYNGSVVLIANPMNNDSEHMLTIRYKEQVLEEFSFVVVDYKHYAVLYSCSNANDSTSSNYELWQLSRTPHVKGEAKRKLNKALVDYGLDVPLMHFNNTETTCKTNSGDPLSPTTVIITSAAAFSLFKRLF